MKDNSLYLEHILDAIDRINISIQNTPAKEDFMNEEDNWETSEIVFRQLEIIGEAVKNLSEDLKVRYPQTPWKQIAGMRDYLIHEYFTINYERVWDTVHNDIPVLEQQIKNILGDLGQK